MSDEETMKNEAITYYFENSGEQNTDKVLEVTNARALQGKMKEAAKHIPNVSFIFLPVLDITGTFYPFNLVISHLKKFLSRITS